MEAITTDDQDAILSSLGQIIARSLPLHEQRRRDAAHEPPYDLLRVIGDAGLLRLPFPTEIGGLGGDWQVIGLVQEYLGQHAWMLGSLFNRSVGFGGMGLMTYASPEQRDALMPRLMRGELLFALALTEPNAGSDAGAVTTSAKRGPNGWVLNGRKTWISDAQAADFMVVVARSDQDAHRSEGLTLFLVPKGTPGVTCTAIPKVGNNCLPSYEVDFAQVELGDDAVFGEQSKGFRNLASTLHFARAGMAASTTGYATFALELALEHARTREQFGRKLGGFQALAHRLADMQMRVDQSRLIAQDLARRISNALPAARQAAQAKVIATECLQYVTHHGMQILASEGYHADSDMARVWRDSRLYSFGEGSNEIQRNIIARELGLGRK